MKVHRKGIEVVKTEKKGLISINETASSSERRGITVDREHCAQTLTTSATRKINVGFGRNLKGMIKKNGRKRQVFVILEDGKFLQKQTFSNAGDRRHGRGGWQGRRR